MLSQKTFAQSNSTELISEEKEAIKIDSFLVNLPLIVVDKQNNFVKGLSVEDFIIYSDYKRQNISVFETSEDPLQIVVMLDVSDSVKKYFKDIQKSAIDFVKVLRPKDKAILITFDCKLNILNEFSDTQLVKSFINQKSNTHSSSGTCIYDSLYEVVENHFATREKSRNVIILLTDGVDNSSKQSVDNLRKMLARTNVVIYTILYNTPFSDKTSKSTLENLIKFTGGRNYKAQDKDTKRIFQSITKELQNQYYLGFYADKDEYNGLHDVRVEVTRQNVKVKTRQSYYLP
jgi:VWFA-related protein